MTGRPRDDAIAVAAGLAYDITNGWTFGIIYTILAGPARWWWGLAWTGWTGWVDGRRLLPLNEGW